jgi:protein-S-isoprenylcysteine O-methyltransferase Ste14
MSHDERVLDAAGSPPNRLPWPPMLFGAGLIVALVLGRLWPAPALLDGPVPRMLGWLLLVAGLALDAWAMVTMTRHRANILPHRPATALVTTGPFAWSRNPIYLGNTLVMCGAGLAFANPWFILAALATAAAVHRLAILREEAHLAARFGASWESYRCRAPRWVVW